MTDKPVSEHDLLTEIRDLLIPVAAHYRPQYEKHLQEERRRKADQLAKLVRGDQARKAVLMMAKGGNEQSSIRASTGIASGNLSPLISRLDEGGYLEPDDRKRPKLIFSENEVKEIFRG